MTKNQTEPVLSRRRALGVGVGVATGTILAGCSSGPATKSTTATKKLTVPAFQQGALPAGAITSTNPLVPLAFETFPHPPLVTVPRKPGNGGKISVFMMIVGSPVPPLSSNQWWQQLNRNLGVDWEPTYVPAAGYVQKSSTMLASGSIPDLSWIRPDGYAPEAQAVQQGAFADLSQVLGGDGVKAYPNLARINTSVWQRSSINGRIYGVPQPLYALNQVTLYRADWAEKLGYPKPPSNAEEVLEVLTAFSKGHPAGKTRTWGIAAFDALLTTFVGNMFRVPNNWRLNSDGTFTYYIETDEYESALTYMNRMWKAGVFNPDALLYQTQNANIPTMFETGRTGFYRPSAGGWYPQGGYQDLFQKANPGGRAQLLPTPGHDGGSPLNHQTNGWWGIAAISATAGKNQKRLAELLRVLDYWSAPFGSKEYDFINMGIEGRQYTFSSAGDPVFTTDPKKLSELGASYFISPASATLYYPGTKGRAAAVQHYFDTELQHSTADPSLGLTSQTFIDQGTALAALNTSVENDIVTGRKPLSALKSWRAQWRSQGGDKIRAELKAALAQSKSGH